LLKEKKLIIFDLDGTILDSAKSLANAINFTLDSLKREKISEDTIRNWIGNGAQMLVKRALVKKRDFDENEIDKELFEKALKIFLDFYSKNLTNGSTLYPNVKNSLLKLKNSGYKLAIATNKPTKFIAPLLEFFEIKEFFDLYIGGDIVDKKKPHPMMLIEISKRLRVDPKFIVMVGDSINDLIAAKRANIDFIALTYGYHGEEEEFFKSEVKIKKFEEILDILGIKNG